MIVKILVTNGAEPLALIYDEAYSVQGMFPVTEDLREIMGTELKQFWHAHLDGTVLHLDEPAPWQNW